MAIADNGIWCQMAEVTAGNCSDWNGYNFTKIYAQYGQWESDGSITVLPTALQITDAITAAGNEGLEIYAWVISNSTHKINVSTAGARSTNTSTLTTLLGTYNFDGIEDDIEAFTGTWQNLVDYANAATTAVNGVAEEYYLAMTGYYAVDMGTTLFASLTVDCLQFMMYGYPLYPYTSGDPAWTHQHQEDMSKSHMDYWLDNATSDAHVIIHDTYWPSYGTITEFTTWVDEQIAAGGPYAQLTGIDVFWHTGMSSADWTVWDSWDTKDGGTPPPDWGADSAEDVCFYVGALDPVWGEDATQDAVFFVMGDDQQDEEWTGALGRSQAALLYESYTTGKDSTKSVYGNIWVAQTFSSSTTHYIDHVVLYATINSTDLGDVTVSIRKTSGGLPTGDDLCSGTVNGDLLPTNPGVYFEVNLNPKTRLEANETYAIVIRSDGTGTSDCAQIGYDDTAASYANGQYCESDDTGSSWTADSGNDFIFYEYGYQLSPKLFNGILKRLESL